MSNRSLYLFATSERPDAYINALAYAVDHLNVDSAHVVVVDEGAHVRNQGALADAIGTIVLGNISMQLKQLASGRYVDFAEDPSKNRFTDLPGSPNTDIYKRCLDLLNISGSSAQVIGIEHLDQSLNRLCSSCTAIFDVTSLKKNVLVDVVSTLISLGESNVYTFELFRKPLFGIEGHHNLYHNLTHKQDFLYRNLGSSDSVRASLERIRRWTVSRKSLLLITVLLAIVFTVAGNAPNAFWSTVLNRAADVATIAAFLFLSMRSSS